MCICLILTQSCDTARELEKEALQTWQRLHADLAGAELIEVPSGGALPLACHIVLMRGSVTLTSADHASVRLSFHTHGKISR